MYIKVKTTYKSGQETTNELSIHQAASYMRIQLENPDVVSSERIEGSARQI